MWICDGTRLGFILLLMFDLCCAIFICNFMMYVILGIELLIVKLLLDFI